MFLKLVFLGLSGYGIFLYCMDHGDGHHNHWGADRDIPSHHHDYNTSREVQDDNFPASPPSPPLIHSGATSSVVTPRSDKDKHHMADIPTVTSDLSDSGSNRTSRVINSNNVTTTITRTVVVKTKFKCGDCFPKDCSIM